MEAAAMLYQQQMCAANVPGQAFNVAWQSESPDLTTIQQTAAAARDAASSAATVLDKTLWPPEVSADVAAVRDGLFAQAATTGGITASQTLDAAFTNAFPNLDASSTASQRLRSRFALPSDPFAGC
jgi:hypothetical protein